MLINTTTQEEVGNVTTPAMKFNCNGYITKLIFLAIPREHATASEIALDNKNGYIHMKINTSKAIHIGGSGTGYELNYSPGELQFEEGNVLSVRLIHNIAPNNLLYQRTGVSYRPLVAIDTGNNIIIVL